MTDAVTGEIVRNYLESVAAEMVRTMVRTAVSPIFNEAHDCSAGVFGYDGETVSLLARADAAPVHIYAALSSAEASLEFFQGDLHEGDVIIVCDPYYGGSHLPDYTVVTPIFIEGEPMFLPSVRGHMPDNGGPAPGGNMNARDIWQEGFRFSPLKLYERGELREDVWEWILRNNRLPENLRADLDAQIGGCRVGARRIRELCDKYGVATVREAVDWLMGYSEHRFREQIRRWPDGRYEAESTLDSDFAGGVDLKVRVALTIDGDSIEADFTGSSPQSPGLVNSVPANTLAFLYTAFSALCPEIPINSGFFRPLTPKLPEASIVNPNPPAPVRAATVTIVADIGDVVMKAAEGFAADRVGTCSIDLLGPWFWGTDRRNGRGYLHYELGCTPTAAGGVYLADGWGAWPATFASADVPSIEMSEVQYPVLYRQAEYLTDGAAPGQWRGTPAWATQRQAYGSDGTHHTIRVQGCYSPLHGFCGGRPAIGNYVVIRYGTPDEEVVPRWSDREPCGEDEIVFFQSGGGGGWGDSLDRDAEMVAEDVRDGYVSPEGARHDYGVCVDPVTGDVDEPATAAERARLREERREQPDWMSLGRLRTLEDVGADAAHQADPEPAAR
ncbi:hydantoinase B/oxoprolinase family protein [Capillimicrobium parvum]|uniref:Acetophenone carboxylase delta subunit n=1 Tax=Capillimicrobium parvum TaxID=2884022 RepID=A0A9E7C2G8_9ACTN|nr:hydantoinase B/oxoprolinase family protein [Capillimicrobium parvum]UGS38431.1 Acetophenone carboxylase delta subunit [Capillimicrobium parvum]